MIDIPPTYCESQQQIAVETMQAVISADLRRIKSANKNNKILTKALDNYIKEQLTVSEFSIMIYEECTNE